MCVNLAQLWMIGRLAIKAGNIPDLAAAQAAQAGFKIEPLFPKTYKKPFAMPARDLYRQLLLELEHYILALNLVLKEPKNKKLCVQRL